MRRNAEKLIRLLGLYLFYLLVAHGAAAQNWPNGYSYQQSITIDYTKVPNTDQTNFPVLISGTYPNLATLANGGAVTNANGYDIIFTSDVNGQNILPFEQESYSPSTGAIVYWVQVPTVSHTSNTVVYMFYGNTAVTTDQSNKNGVWDTNYMGVWHLPNGSTLNANDSTGNGNNATSINGATATTGMIDGAANFVASSGQRISIPDNSTLKPTNLTFSLWVRPSGNQQQYAHVVEKGKGASAPWGSYDFQMNDSGSDSTEGAINIGTTDNNITGVGFPSGSFSSGNWYYIVGTFDSSTKVLSAYKNGQLIGTATTAVGTILYDTTGLFFGYQYTYGQYFNGVLDEVRVSNIARSADWIATEYNNESSPSNFYSVGSVQTGSGSGPSITNLSPASGPFGASVTISGTNFGTTQGSSTVAFDGLAASSITSWSNSQIVATVPNEATTGPIVVTVNSVQSTENPIFTLTDPVIESLSPSGSAVYGTVIVNGSGFGSTQGSSEVQINGVTVTASSWSDSSITMTIPSNVTSGPVTVTRSSVTSNGVEFTLLESLSVTSISEGTAGVASPITITGTGFGSSQSNSTVTFDGAAAGAATSWSDTQITINVPPGASSGNVAVEVAAISASGPWLTLTGTAEVTDSLGNQSSYASEVTGGKWYLTNSQGSGCSSCTLRGTVQNSFNSPGNGNLLSTMDELGNVTSYTYDSSNDVASVTQPAVGGTNPVTSYTYNSFGEVLTATDALGNVTTSAYDSHGNLTSVTTPAPNGNTAASVTQFAYNSLGELTQITDPLGRITTLAYTSVGLVASITDPQNNVTTYGYDSRGNRTSITDPTSHQTTFTYDAGNRLTQITYPDSSTMTFGYDYRGRRTSVTDQTGKTTTYAYDDADRLVSVTDAGGNVTQYGYDTENNLTSITDANSHTTAFTYDAYGRVTKTTFPSNNFETYGYDSDNNLTSKTDRNGQTIQYVYDALNRLSQKDYPNSTMVEYTYDLVGKILQVNDPTGTYGFSYDNMGRLIGTSTVYSFLPNSTFTNSYSYDANSNRTGYTAPDSSTNTYTYDTLNRLTGLTSSWAGSFGFSYDSLSRRTQMTRPNNVTTNYSYDNLSRLLSVLHQLSGSTIDGETYTMDAAGNRTSKADQLAGVTSSYSYDSIYELLKVTQGTNTTENYTYDPVGNRLTSLAAASYSYNNSNELTSDSNESYTYDSNGNTLSETNSSGTTNYTWDYENRLTSASLPNSGGTVTFKYDAFGRRVYKQSPNTTSIFVYDGNALIQTVNASGGLVTRYTQGQNIDEPMAMERGSTIDYYEADGLGSVTSLTASNGSVAQSYTYDSFGNTMNSQGSLTNFFRYTAREFDSETNLYYDRARYYDPSPGRFIGEDPVGFFGGMNFYAYVHNNAVSLSDPFGLCDKKCKGMARVLEGNPSTIGSPGGWSGPSVGNVNVTAGSAAVVTSQWGGKGSLRQNIGQVSATFNGQSLFTGISDIIGGKSPIPGMTAGNALMSLYPGDLIIELPSGNDLGVVPIELTIPATMNCPVGTTQEP